MGERKDGYMATKNAQDAKEQGKEPKQVTGRVTGGNLNVREKPDAGSKIVGVLKDGSEVRILKAGKEWHKTEAGYVMAKWVEMDG